jgi:hypothetical protein
VVFRSVFLLNLGHECVAAVLLRLVNRKLGICDCNRLGDLSNFAVETNLVLEVSLCNIVLLLELVILVLQTTDCNLE